VVAGLPTPTARPTLDVAHSPTPDATRVSVLSRQTVEQYTVQRNDTLNKIGARYGVTAQQIAQANGLLITDILHVGQVLLIPLPDDAARGPDRKLLPDSELVYGPAAIDFNIDAFVQSRGGYLAAYREEVDGYLLDGQKPTETLAGSEIVRVVALRYSVNPRVLLAVLEHQAGWVTNPLPDGNTLVYPLRRVEVGREGLYRQLAWAANQLNQGYYGWRAGWLISFNFDDGGLRLAAPGLNAGTVAVQNYFAKVMLADDWTRAVSAEGFAQTYQALFGNPFRRAVEPLFPPDLTQPALALPFEAGKVWAFTGGPHGAWDTGSAWAALDFAPPAQAEGCVPSDEWVTASAPGLVVRSEYGGVVVDLDGDGYEGSGWALFYMHVEARDRIAAGAAVDVGDRLGHPSCEGGVANGTHVHLARKYNGEWIEASGPLAFVLDGWTSAGLGREYDGVLSRDGVFLEACDCRAAGNEISR
jgi:LysM repeat protein